MRISRRVLLAVLALAPLFGASVTAAAADMAVDAPAIRRHQEERLRQLFFAKIDSDDINAGYLGVTVTVVGANIRIRLSPSIPARDGDPAQMGSLLIETNERGVIYGGGPQKGQPAYQKAIKIDDAVLRQAEFLADEQKLLDLALVREGRAGTIPMEQFKGLSEVPESAILNAFKNAVSDAYLALRRREGLRRLDALDKILKQQ